MTPQNKLFMRLAIAIHAQLDAYPNTTASVELPTAAWQQCELLNRKLRKASRRGWQFAADHLRRDLRQSLERLAQRMPSH